MIMHHPSPLLVRALPLTLLVVLTGRYVAAAEPGVAEAHRLKLTFITCAVDQTFFVPVKHGMKDAARMLGVDCEFVGTPGVDVPAQVAMVRRAVADGVDGIALNVIDATAFDAVIDEALAAGVPVVAFNVDDFASPSARLAAVSQKFLAAGKAVARRALPEIPAGAHVLLTRHDEGVSALDERQRGEQEILAAKGIRWTGLVTGNHSTEGSEVVATALRENPDIRVVLCSGQADTEAAGRAIADHFAGKGYWAAGFDLSPTTLELIKTGHIRFVVDQQPYVQGFYPVVQLVLKLRYGIAPSDIDAGAGVIDRTNVDQVEQLSVAGYR